MSTRRYRVYRRFVSSVISDKYFTHYRINELSLYILVNKQVETEQSSLVDMIIKKVKEAYRS